MTISKFQRASEQIAQILNELSLDKVQTENAELRKKLAEQQAYINRLCGVIDSCHVALVDMDSRSVAKAVSTIPDPYPVHSTAELTLLLYAAKQEGYEQGKNDAINCYSPDDTVSDYQDKIRSLSSAPIAATKENKA
jgi:alkylated DNA repair dioxygenase AlkB